MALVVYLPQAHLCCLYIYFEESWSVLVKIEHDIHLHTHLSRCGKTDATVENYVKTAKQLGIKLLGFTDHMWDSTFPGCPAFYDGQDFNHIELIKEEIALTAHDGIKILHGAEVEYDPHRRDLAITEDHLRRLDYIIVPNSHTHMVMPREYYADKQKHADFMLTAFMDIMYSPLAKSITAIAHPFCAVDCPYGFETLLSLISDSQYKECFAAAKENDIAVEINLSKFRDYSISQIKESNNTHMFEIAKSCGCKFSFGSDAHTMSHLDKFNVLYVVAEVLGLGEENLCSLVRNNLK